MTIAGIQEGPEATRYGEDGDTETCSYVAWCQGCPVVPNLRFGTTGSGTWMKPLGFLGRLAKRGLRYRTTFLKSAGCPMGVKCISSVGLGNMR